MKRVLLLALVALVLCTPAAMAANHVQVTSVNVSPGQTGVNVPIFISNDVTLRSVTVPLVVREITPGAYVTNSVTMTITDRLASALTDLQVRQWRSLEDGTCKSGQAGGFGTITEGDGAYAGPFNSPDCFYFASNFIFSSPFLNAGTDATGSYVLTFDVTGVEGCFEIDSTCANPASHVAYVQQPTAALVPTFGKGIVSIGAGCVSNAAPVAACQDVTVEEDGSCTANPAASLADGGSTDADGDPLSFSFNPAGPYPVGQTQVWLVVSDGTDKDSCQAMITVEDNTPPVVTCEVDADTLFVDGNCEVSLPGYFNINISDNCSNDFITSQEPPPGTMLGPGLHPVMTILDDKNGNKDTCTFTVLVLDNTPPSAVCPGNITVSNDVDECGAVVNYADGGSTDNCGIASAVFTPASGSFFPVGTTPVELIVTDDAGNADTCTFNVTVTDDQAPVALCPADIVEQLGVGETEKVVNFVVDFTDNCPGGSVAATPASGSTFPLGTTPVVVIATDASGDADTCTFNVTLNAGTAPPQALCIDRTVDADGNCEALANIDNGSFDPDGGSLTYEYFPPGPYPLGTTPVMLIVTDDEGDKDTCNANVTVVDNTAPVAVCHTDTTIQLGLGETNVAVDFTSGVSDNCVGASIACVPPSGSVFAIGQTLVTCIATDNAGNADTCSFTVTVLGAAAPPVAICADRTVNAGSECTADANIDNGSFDPDGGALTYELTPPGPYGLGTTNVRLIVTDNEGDKDTCFANVTVNDVTDPVVTCQLTEVEASVDANCEYVLGDYTQDGAFSVSDNCTPNGALTFSQDPAPGTILGVGNHTITIYAEDASGNSGSCSFTLHVIDDTPPVAACPDDITVGNDPGQCGAVVNFADGLSSDNCGLSSTVFTPPSGSFFPVGTTQVELVVTDESGNTDNCFFSVTVNDTEQPIALCPSDIYVNINLPETTTVVEFTSAPGDNCPGVTISCTPPSGSTFGIGATLVTCIAVDAHGNEDTCSFYVNVTAVSEPIMEVTPDSIFAKAVEGGANPDSVEICVSNIGTGGSIGVSFSESETWLSIDPLFVITDDCAWLKFAIGGLTPGVYTADVYVCGTLPSGSGCQFYDTVKVVLQINSLCDDAGIVCTGGDSLIFKATNCPDAPAPDCQYFDVIADNECDLPWDAYYDAPWLSLDQTSGGTPTKVQVCVDPTGLAPGLYKDTIYVYENNDPIQRSEFVPDCMIIVCFQVLECPAEPQADIWLTDDCGALGDTVGICVNFCNNFLATGISLGLHYDNPAIRIVGASFAGSRVEYLGANATASWDDVDQTICLAAYVIPQQALIDTGCGKFATLYFLVEDASDCPDSIVVKIDSMFVEGGCEPLLTDANLEPVYPSFDFGTVCIKCPTECNLCSVVRDGEENPIEGATVQLWDEYPTGSVLDEVVTGPDGAFCFEGLDELAHYDIRIVAPGFCPGIFEDLPCGPLDSDLYLSPLPVVETQPFAADWWSNASTNEGVLLLPGDVITATDPNGVVCGVTVVTDPGTYLIQVVGDNPLTEGVDEGAQDGEEITLYLNCECPLMAEGLWHHLGSTQFDAAFDCGRRTVDIPLCDVWTLISFNVLPPSPLVGDVLSSIDGEYQHLLSATCTEGNISWEKDRPINDLTAMDPCHGYWVKATAPGVGPIVIEGAPLPADKPLYLCEGWNAISYVPTQEDSVEHALGSIDGEYAFVFTATCDGYQTWDRERPAILNDLKCMREGYGYWILMDQEATLTYPVSGYNCPENVLEKPVNLTQRVTVTPRAADYWSAADPSVTGINAGDRITVKTQTGVIVGEALAGTNGMFMVHVYGDDPTTNLVDGAQSGEALVFEVNGVAAKVESGNPNWTERTSREITLLSAGASPLPTEFSLLQNYPNPFNAGTNIAFRLPQAGEVNLVVYNVLGNPVRTLQSGHMEAGEHTIAWDGKSDNGSTVQSGVYFY
ncbi:MAG: HYR domain-containing protein, partial [Candidatus Zixiibacteriota bacterium]